MKLIKKITATVTALALAVGMMSIGASAYNYNLHQTYMAPSSDNVVSQTLTFKALYNGRTHGESTSFNLTSGAVAAMAKRKNLIYGYYYEVGSTQIYGTGLYHIYSNDIHENDNLKVIVELTNLYAYGNAKGSYT